MAGGNGKSGNTTTKAVEGIRTRSVAHEPQRRRAIDERQTRLVELLRLRTQRQIHGLGGGESSSLMEDVGTAVISEAAWSSRYCGAGWSGSRAPGLTSAARSVASIGRNVLREVRHTGRKDDLAEAGEQRHVGVGPRKFSSRCRRPPGSLDDRRPPGRRRRCRHRSRPGPALATSSGGRPSGVGFSIHTIEREQPASEDARSAPRAR